MGQDSWAALEGYYDEGHSPPYDHMTQENELTYQKLVELVTAYLEDALPLGEGSRFDAHLNVCPGCAPYLDQMRQTIRLVGTLTEDDIVL